MNSPYLGINDYKIGPPPDWRDYKHRKRKHYIAAVEAYIIAQHNQTWQRICELDEERARTGELMSEIEDALKPLMDRVSKRAAEWRGPCPVEEDE